MDTTSNVGRQLTAQELANAVGMALENLGLNTETGMVVDEIDDFASQNPNTQGGSQPASGEPKAKYRKGPGGKRLHSDVIAAMDTFNVRLKKGMEQLAIDEKVVKMHYQVNKLEPILYINAPPDPPAPNIYPAFSITAGMANGDIPISQFIGGTILPISLRVDYTSVRCFGPAISGNKAPNVHFRLGCIQHCDTLASLDPTLVYDVNPIQANSSYYSRYIVPNMKNFNELADVFKCPHTTLISTTTTTANTTHPNVDGFFTVAEKAFVPIVWDGAVPVTAGTSPISGEIVVYLGQWNYPTVLTNSSGTTSFWVETYTTMTYLDEL